MNYWEFGAHINDPDSNVYYINLITVVTYDFIFTSTFLKVVLTMNSILKEQLKYFSILVGNLSNHHASHIKTPPVLSRVNR